MARRPALPIAAISSENQRRKRALSARQRSTQLSSASAATAAPVADANIAPGGTLTVEGTPKVGQTVNMADLVYDDDGIAPDGRSYQWQVQNANGDWVPLEGASGNQPFTLTEAQLGRPLRDVTFTVVDLETTGGSPRDCGITEIGAVKVRGGEELGELQTFVDPGEPIPAFIQALTGITDAMVRDAPRTGAAVTSFLEFAKGAVLVAHNAGFDMGVIRGASEAVGGGLLGVELGPNASPWRLYRHGALLVGASGPLAGCLAWLKA